MDLDSTVPPIPSGEDRASCIKIGSILKNEKVMAHENSRGTLQRYDRLRGKWLIVIMNKHYRGNCDIFRDDSYGYLIERPSPLVLFYEPLKMHRAEVIIFNRSIDN